ncbi:MAG: hypothetical protein ACT4RN_01780 [Pseudonocardia sp.]
MNEFMVILSITVLAFALGASTARSFYKHKERLLHEVIRALTRN